MEEPHGAYQLPDGWEWRLLPRVAYITMGQSPPGSTYNSDQIGLPFFQGKADFGDIYPTARVWCDKPKKVAEPGDVLISVRAPVGPTNIVAERCAIGRGLAAIRPKDGLPSRLLREYFVHIERQVADKGTGSTFTAISKDVLESLAFPLPPLPEQRRLADKIERLLAQSRTAREALDRIPPLLKRFRKAVLAKAFRGELTERDPNDEPASVLLERIREERRRKWEEDLRARGKDPRKAKYVEAEAPDTRGLPKLPEAWTWASFDQILVELRNGFFSGSPAMEPPGIPILRISAVRPMQVSYASPRYVRKTGRGDPRGYGLAAGDLLFTRYNGSIDLVGVCGLVRNPPPTLIYPDKLMRARVVSGLVSPAYLEAYFATRIPRGVIEDKAKSSAGQQGISGRDLRSVPVALAPRREQLSIVEKVDYLFGRATTVEESAARSRVHAAHLDRAVLARAFRGEL